MVQLLLIVCIAAIHLAENADQARLVHWTAPAVWAAAWVPPLLLWLLFQVLALRCGRLMDDRGNISALPIADRAMSALRISGVCWHIFCVFGLGWPEAVRATIGDPVLIDELLILAPVLALFIGLWWSLYPLDLRVREAVLRRELECSPVHPPFTLAQYISSCIRHQMLIVLIPLLLLTTWEESVGLFSRRFAPSLLGHDLWERIEPWARYIGMALVLIISPALLRIAWDTVSIGPGEVRSQARSMLTQYGVRVRGPYLWRTHGAMVNGAILGLVFPLRYLLLTDALLERLSTRHLDGVLAHEVAHVKKHHLPWLALCLIASVLIAGWAASLAAYALAINDHSPWFDAAASVLALLAAGLTLGHVSRRFEWQADAFAARHLSESGGSDSVTPIAAATMSDALQSVADLNGIPIARFTWRHGSILTRQLHLESLIGSPTSAMPIDVTVRRLKIIAGFAMLAGLAPFVWEIWS